MSEILEKLLEHNNWANLQIVEACSTLSDEQLDAEPQSATKGSIRSTLTHMVSSQRGYLSLLTLPAEKRSRTPVPFAELEKSVRASGEGLLALARDEKGKLPKEQILTVLAGRFELISTTLVIFVLLMTPSARAHFGVGRASATTED